MVNFKFWQSWLMAVSALIILFGVLIALLNWTDAFTIFNWLVNGTFWPGMPTPPDVEGFKLWAYGMLGATMVGWGIFLYYIVRYPFAKMEKWSWDCIALGVGAWFAIDTAVSAYAGAYFNVAVNLLILVLVALPLAMVRSHFAKEISP